MTFFNKSDSLLREIGDDKKPVSDEEKVFFGENDDEGFVLLECNNDNVEDEFERDPWLESDHPLYFPSTQANDITQLTRWGAVDKFSVENWYSQLKKFTFASEFFSLDSKDIQFLMGNIPPDYDITKLERAFDLILTQFKNHEAFMRLSTRSPKDSQSLFDEAAVLMSNDFTYWNETGNKNQQLVSFVASMAQAMKITSGRKIIETIQGSPRVYNDFIALLSLEQSNETTKIVFREWYNIRPEHEFRIFVSRRCRAESIITGISQYFHFLYFDKTSEDGFNFFNEESMNAISLKFQEYILKLVDPEVAHFLNFSNEQNDDDTINCVREYVVDLALIPVNEYRGDVFEENQISIGGHHYVITVIELNPFAPAATGASLFNWKRDLNSLWGKEQCDYPILRYRTEPRESFHSISLLRV